MAREISRCLVIGIGGTGQKVIHGIKKKFLQRYGLEPAAVKFLSIDTDKRIDEERFEFTYQGENRNEIVKLADYGEFLKLEPTNFLESWKTNKHIQEFSPDNLPQIAQGLIQGAGANGIRIIGRLHSFIRDDQIENKINAHINTLEDINSLNAKLGSQNFNQINVQQNNQILICIVGSWSGGTGSGVLWDILSYLGKMVEVDQKALLRFGYFFMPDFYTHYANTRNVKANAYGTFLEMDHVFDPGVRTDDDLSFEIAGYRFNEAPLDCLNIIQKQSGGIVLNTKEAYGAMASAIANLSSGIGSQVLSSLVNADQRNYKMNGKYRNYSSIGVGEITINRPKILMYGSGKLLIPLLNKYIAISTEELSSVSNEINQFIDHNNLNEGETVNDAKEINELIDTLHQPSLPYHRFDL